MSEVKTILIVDDEEIICDSIKQILELSGYRAVTANNGSSALDLLSMPVKQIDLIIADVNMPDIDGKRILTAVKEIEPETPVIIITGIDVAESRAFAEEHQAEGFLAKPINAENLLPLIEKIIR